MTRPDLADSLRVLVVDDDPSVLALLEQYLRRSGYSPLTAINGSEALAKVRDEEPDLILLDIMLPDISGHEVCARIRAERSIRQIPIVMMTAHGDREILVRCLENGADDFIRKPIDLSELKARLRAQARSLEFRQFHRDFFESFPAPLFILKADGTIEGSNHAASELLGLTGDSTNGHLLVSFVAADERDVFDRALRLAPESSAPVVIPEIRFQTGTSGARSCELEIQSLARNTRRFLVTAVDRTHRRYLESELYKTRDFLESIVQSSVDGIIAVNRKGTIVVFNEGAQRVTGYRVEDVVGRMHIAELYTEGGERDVMRKLRSPDFGGIGKLETSSYFIVGKNGEQIPVNLSASLLHDASGQEVGSVGIFQDLRERIRIEQELSGAREKLMESEKTRAMLATAGTIAHELNQPLTAITGFTLMLKERGNLDQISRNLLEKIANEAERMADTIKKITKMTKFETKQYLNNTQIVDLERSSEGGESAATRKADTRPQHRAPGKPGTNTEDG